MDTVPVTAVVSTVMASVDWARFEGFLVGKKLRRCYVRDVLSYARRYGGLLESGNLSAVEGLSGSRMVLASLANLSKFEGCYGKFKEMRVQAGLVWNTKASEDVFSEIYGGKQAISSVEAWMESLSKKVNWDVWFPTVYCALSGLRTGEAIGSLNLIANGEMERNYLNKELGVLEHFRYRETFIRRSKKAFITVVGDGLLKELESWKKKTTYDKLRSFVRRKKLECRFYDCRKWFGTVLRMNGLPTEFVDLLCGRISDSTFVQHYWRPDIKVLLEKAREILRPYERKWLS